MGINQLRRLVFAFVICDFAFMEAFFFLLVILISLRGRYSQAFGNWIFFFFFNF